MPNKTILFVALAILLIPLTSFAHLEISDGSMLALYHMEEDCVDASGNGENLTEANGNYMTGKIGSYAFDGTVSNTNKGCYTDASSPFGLDLTQIQTEIGVSFWVYSRASTANQAIWVVQVQNGSTQRANYGMYNNSGTLRINVYDGTANQYNTSQTLTLNTWFHVVMNFDGTEFNVYVNDSNVLTQTRTISQASDAQTSGGGILVERTNGSSANWLKGAVDEVVILDREFTSDEITALYNNGTGEEACSAVGCGTDSVATSTQQTTFPSMPNSSGWFVIILAGVIVLVIFYKQ